MRPESPDVLLGYLREVGARTTAMLEGLAPSDLDRSWTAAGILRSRWACAW